MRPADFLRLAERLLDDEAPQESTCRGAAHAAYHSVYHLMAAHFGLDPSTKGTAPHALILDKLDNLDFASAPKFARRARRVYRSLYDLRVHADYRLNRPFSPEDAEQAVEHAGSVHGLNPE